MSGDGDRSGDGVVVVVGGGSCGFCCRCCCGWQWLDNLLFKNVNICIDTHIYTI